MESDTEFYLWLRQVLSRQDGCLGQSPCLNFHSDQACGGYLFCNRLSPAVAESLFWPNCSRSLRKSLTIKRVIVINLQLHVISPPMARVVEDRVIKRLP